VITTALAALLAQAATAEAPPGLQFGFFRMAAFRQRARDLGCSSGTLDDELDTLRKRLAARYGKQAFAWPKTAKSGPGECQVTMSVYQVNLADFRREAEAALAQP
jgi:hypothetical protein